MAQYAAVITDIVRSRDLTDRVAGQKAVRAGYEAADGVVTPHESVWATAGDEFQAVYVSGARAVVATLIVRLSVSAGFDCRFGIGIGERRLIERDKGDHPIEDGSAWWYAREAIDEVHTMQTHGQRSQRTWLRSSDPGEQNTINALLLAQDQLVSRLTDRERRIAFRYLTGAPQNLIARDEHISQSAVSQNLAKSGGTALRRAMELLLAA
jgi:DNA-binding CsgD family transcriptional regulator